MLWWSIRTGLFLVAIAGAGFHLLGSGGGLPDRVRPAAKPAVGQTPAETFGSEMKVRAAADGHFYIEAEINSTPVRFMLDTGATGIALAAQDAARAGLRPAPHEYTMEASTANGAIWLAPVSLREVRVGNFSTHDVPAAVNKAPMHISLLGMSFLQRLQSYEVRGNTLHLRW